jgi:gluconokinase
MNLTPHQKKQYHPKTNLSKISRNQPLTDADRAAWLRALRAHASAPPPADAPSPHFVVTCSALKRQYRDVLREGGQGRDDVRVRFVFLDVDEEVLRQRARERTGHFAGEGLVGSQMEALERPGEGEVEGDVLVVGVGRGRGVRETVGEVVRGVRGVMGV